MGPKAMQHTSAAERNAALRLIRLAIAGTIVLPLLLLAYASWTDYRATWRTADERIERVLDVVHEHANKVFEAVDLAFLHTSQIFDGVSDEEIRAHEAKYHALLKRIGEIAPEIQSVILFDRTGHLLVSSRVYPVSGEITATGRDYFQAQLDGDSGTYIGDVVTEPTPSEQGFTVSRRRIPPDGAFAGVVRLGIRSAEIESFYADLGHLPGSVFSMLREDGTLLARYPTLPDQRNMRLGASSTLRRTIAEHHSGGIFSSVSPIDGVERRMATRKLEHYPIYLSTGLATAAIRDEWLLVELTDWAFVVPLMAIMVTSLAVALKRTRKLHDEADRRAAAEAALRQAQRMEGIGQLTGGVAHDFNNLLTIVSGGVAWLRRRDRDAQDARYLDMIATAAQRGEQLTRQLLTFARRQALAPELVDLSQSIPDIRDLLNRSLRGDIGVVVDVPPQPCWVKMDPAEFELAILNIAVNARDAMNKGGILSIQVRSVGLDRGPEGLTGAFAEIAVSDTGTGIAPELLARVFDPFFTTKGIGKGTGLGLSQVYGFAKQSGGAAVIRSIAGQGTTVTLYVPLTDERPKTAVRDETLGALAPCRGTVLVVEDNEEVAEVCLSYLAELGLDVERAGTAKEALTVLERHPAIDLIFSDILMPGEMNGLDLAREVRRVRPRIPVVLTTGYSSSAQDALREGFTVLRKPYDIGSLRRMFSAALQGRAGFSEVRVAATLH